MYALTLSRSPSSFFSAFGVKDTEGRKLHFQDQGLKG